MLVSLALFSVTVVLASIVVNSVKVIRDSSYENGAFRIAANKLDELRAGGYAALSEGGPFVDAELARLPQGLASTSVTAWNDATKKVVAGVSWQGADGTVRYVSLTTLITENGGL